MADQSAWRYDREWIRRWIIVNRTLNNQNNCTRTDFYLKYWDAYREVPWALIAHVVSRNAGYQMSDLVRLRSFLEQKRSFGLHIMQELYDKLVDLLFIFVETGNFLIFYDVFPQLTAYAWAKHLYIHTGRDYSLSLFDMLAEDDFGVDPFIVEEWKGFFKEAKRASWWDDTPHVAAQDAVARQTLALVANEQNYIE